MNSPNLKIQRERAGLKQIDLALQAGVHPSLLCRYERGVRPNRRTAQRLASALGCTVQDLFAYPNTLRRY